MLKLLSGAMSLLTIIAFLGFWIFLSLMACTNRKAEKFSEAFTIFFGVLLITSSLIQVIDMIYFSFTEAHFLYSEWYIDALTKGFFILMLFIVLHSLYEFMKPRTK